MPTALQTAAPSVPWSPRPPVSSSSSPPPPLSPSPPLLPTRTCPICETSTESTVFAEANLNRADLDEFAFASRKTPEYMHHRLMACAGCDLLYASPLPERDELARAYLDAAFDSGEEAACAARTYARYLPDLRRELPNLDGVLDIGAGDGVFLRQLLDAKFKSVIGVEPSAAPIAAAEPSLRPLIRQGIFREEDFEPDSLSLITCFQTLEHVPDPLEMCRAAWRLLKPGGAVFFVTHDRRALSAKLLGRKSPIFDIEHLQLFSRQSMQSMLNRAGFTRIRLHRLLNRYPIHYWMKLLPFPAATKRRLIPRLKASRLGKGTVPFFAGNLVAIALKPRKHTPACCA